MSCFQGILIFCLERITEYYSVWRFPNIILYEVIIQNCFYFNEQIAFLPLQLHCLNIKLSWNSMPYSLRTEQSQRCIYMYISLAKVKPIFLSCQKFLQLLKFAFFKFKIILSSISTKDYFIFIRKHNYKATVCKWLQMILRVGETLDYMPFRHISHHVWNVELCYS